jgi:hypothetical protein
MEIQMGTELVNVNEEHNNILAALEGDDLDALMKASGQDDGASSSNSGGLPRLTINYSEETDDGLPLKKGVWKIWNGSAVMYAETVQIRALYRTFEWSIWDQETQKFSCRSVQRTSIFDKFPDTEGGNKCGRLSKKEESELAGDDPRVLLSQSVTCNQVLYGVITATGTLADGTETSVTNMPFVGYFKRSGFRPVSDFIKQKLTDKKILMQKAIIEMTTEKHKNGGVIFWTPKLSLVKEVSVTQEDKDLLKYFLEMVNTYNEGVMEQYRTSAKMLMDDEDVDLAERLAG